jgi:hypothetical protein
VKHASPPSIIMVSDDACHDPRGLSSQPGRI